jgi:hypothetical protein
VGRVGIGSNQTIWNCIIKEETKMVLNKLNTMNRKKDLVKKIDGHNFTAVYASDEKGKLEKLAEKYRESGYLARIKKGTSDMGTHWEMLLVRKK